MNSCTMKQRQSVSSIFYLRGFCLFCLLLLTALPLQAVASETVFLPIKVTSADDTTKLAANVDKLFTEALDSQSFMIIDRPQAETMADYVGSWPPPVNTLKSIAEKSGADNVVIGNLTKLGNSFSLDVKIFDSLNPSNPTYLSSQSQNIDNLTEAVNEIASALTGYTKQGITVATIAPEGNKRIDSGAILRRIKTKAGSIYDPSVLREDLKAIYAMGYFDDVQIDVSDSGNAKKVIFRVVEKPVITSLTYDGMDDLKEKDLKDVVNIQEQSILNPAKINEGVEAIKALYKSKGYYDTQVKADISYPTAETAVVQYKIDEGDKIYIKTISFEGNTAFDDDELAGVIDTGEKWFMSWLTSAGLLKPEKIKIDASKLVAYYHNHGYLEAKVGEPIVTQEKEWLYVTFTIEEGPRFRLGTVDIKGDLISDKQDILNLLKIRDEEFLSRQQLRDDVLRITDYYAERGYAFADVRPEMNKSDAGQRVDVTISITKSDLVYINRIAIAGNTRTRDNVIRRDLSIEEGGIFNSKALRASNQALQRLGYFEEVNITPEPTLNPSQMDINIDVKEKSTGSFSIGAGYSSVDNLILMGQIAERNFLGRGDTLSLSANVGGSSSLYNLAYTNPRVNDSNLTWGADLYSTEREYDDYTRDSTGGGIRLGYPIWEKWKIYGNYSYTDTTLSDVSDDASYIIRNSVDIHITSAFKTSLIRDTRNNYYMPTSGSKNLISVKYAGGPLSGDAQFTKVEASSSWFFPLFMDTAFHIKGSAGQVFENEDDKLPVYERFYLGGMSTMRGFEYGKVSPKDPDTDERIGGDRMWYSNIELIFPLAAEQGIFGVVFYDTGNVFNDDESFSFSSPKQSTGIELRWMSPLGPLRVVWGYNLNPDDDEDTSVWDFSIGGSF